MKHLLLLPVLLLLGVGCAGPKEPIYSWVRPVTVGARGPVSVTGDPIPVSVVEVERFTGISRYAPPEIWAQALNQFTVAHKAELW